MINEVIERLRQQLYEESDPQALCSNHTLQLSQELNNFINFHNRITSGFNQEHSSNTNVHATILQNILDISFEERLELPFLQCDEALRTGEWVKIGLVCSLLNSISEKYGWEAVHYIGELVPDKCYFPETITNFQESIEELNNAYYFNHRSNVYIGEYLPYTGTKNEILLFCHTPHYFTEFNHGLIKGLSKKYNQSLKVSVLTREHGGQFKIVV
ncbi:aspartyl-phosphate phosphatase Spo0E family protein [Bacillus sp. T33-2]|uniref:aspartyl-phosphate phosphatase Spo0E family protein n=1 Tax=Bacillus sp. T33-2 TaxID=2054168 RepID=UPI0015E0EE12|nr:aspartyl-phosphate phosphatase Spo0E family protein [Bacillus sp. T33-2]